MPPTPQLMASNLAEAAEIHNSQFSAIRQPRQMQSIAAANEPEPVKEYVSKISILASSMPYYHNQYMESRKANRHHEEERSEPHDSGVTSFSLDADPREQSTEEQAATARRLKPHSRSTIQLQHITANAAETAESHSQADKKKGKATKWQFGIRSRNQPLDAMLCIYRALHAQGAQWIVPPPRSAPKHGPSLYPVNISGATHLHYMDAQLSESPEKDRHARTHESHHSGEAHTPKVDTDHAARSHGHASGEAYMPRFDLDSDDDDVDPTVFPPNYIPKDPWCIHVRWRKDGMYPPGTIHSSSAHSSRIDLNADDQARRRSSIIGSLSSATGSTTSVGAGPSGPEASTTDNACYVYMDVQLYMLETDCYLVDFKCAGYEMIVEKAINESEKVLVGSGIRVLDKDVTSPQPYLDLTNKLVIHLARGG